MKTKNRTLAWILAALMTASSLVACSDTTSTETAATPANPSAAETAAETEPALTDGLEDKDFGGYEFRILSCMFGGDEGAHRIMYEDYTGNPVHDTLRDSTLTIEDRFKVRMTYISAGNEFETQTTTQTSILVDDDAFDIVISHDGLTFGLAKQGLFYNMYDIEQFDFTKPWWPEGSVKALSLDEQLYCASSYLSYLGLHWTRAIMFNKDFMTNMNVELPYDLVRSGEWTLDKMIDMVSGMSYDVNGNGKIDSEDDVGFCTGTQTYYCLQEALGLSPYKKIEGDLIEVVIDQERMDKAVQLMRGLIDGGDYAKGTAGFGEDLFKTGRVMVCYGQIGDAYDFFRDCDFSYGFLPSPKLDEIQENYINCCTDLPWAIPRTIKGDQPEIIGTVVEALSCENYKNVLPAYFDVAMKNRTADSPDDAEMLQLIADTRAISFAYSYGMPFSNALSELAEGNREVASYYKSNEKMAQKQIEQMLEAFAKMKLGETAQ